jgi:hypothetical protein
MIDTRLILGCNYSKDKTMQKRCLTYFRLIEQKAKIKVLNIINNII